MLYIDDHPQHPNLLNLNAVVQNSEIDIDKLDLIIKYELYLDSKNDTTDSCVIEYLNVPYKSWKRVLMGKFPSFFFHFVVQGGISYLANICAAQDDLLQFEVQSEEGRMVSTQTQTFMAFKVFPVGSSQIDTSKESIEKSFKSKLTQVGIIQRDILKNFLIESFKIFLQCKTYAPISCLIQSSGSGKSKICNELLLLHPGITAVFRGDSKDKDKIGFPPEQSWVADMSTFIYSGKKDEFPAKDFMNGIASKYSPGCFLIALRTLITSYYKWYAFLRYTKCLSREDSIKAIGEHFRSEAKDWGHNPHELSFQATCYETLESVLNDIYWLLNLNSVDSSKGTSKKTNLGLSIDLVTDLMPEESSSFPFMLFFDEASIFDNCSASKNRLSGLHVVCRGLHMLKPPARLFLLTIGTNSDAIDFSPSLRSNSIRIPERKNLLPPLWLTCNFDIFSKQLALHNIEVTPDFVLNRNVMNLLLALGRPLWGSYSIENALNMAMVKINNGKSNGMEALISYLLCRADLSVSPASVLCRNLVKSHMAVVRSISSDSRVMKISYPSEPALAISSRQMLVSKEFREMAFDALLSFVQRRSIDKGRMSETIIEHFVLFAIDDVVKDEEYIQTFVHEKYLLTTNSGTGNAYIDKVLGCKSFILDIDWSSDNDTTNPSPSSTTSTSSVSGTSTSYSSASSTDIPAITAAASSIRLRRVAVDHGSYHVISVYYFLKSLLNEKVFLMLCKYLPNYEALMNGFINSSHFVNLENDTTGTFFKHCDEKSLPFTIDRNLLKMGLIRGCGFVLPPGTFGLDFIIPVLLDCKDSFRRPNYSFIGVQVKTSMGSYYQEVAKTAASFFVQKCLKHAGCLIGHHHTGCMTDLEYEEVVRNQLSLILCIDKDKIINKVKGISFTAKPEIVPSLPKKRQRKNSDNKEIDIKSFDPENEGEEETEIEEDNVIMEEIEEEEEMEIAESENEMKGLGLSKTEVTTSQDKRLLANLKRAAEVKYAKNIAQNLWPSGNGLGTFNEVNPNFFAYPTFSRMEDTDKPDLLIRNVVNDTLSVQNLIWASGNNQRLTCIISNDLSNLLHLVNPKTIELCKQIVIHVDSIFDDIENIHLTTVIDSALNGGFSNFYQFNPELRQARGLQPISSNLAKMENYEITKLELAISSSITRTTGE